MHSLWSDGSASIADMAAAAVELNYEYIAITDHAKGLKIAGGIDEAQLREQAAEIAAVNRSLDEAGHNLRVLRSIELNLNPAGDGDMEPQALDRARHRHRLLSFGAAAQGGSDRYGTSRPCAIRRFRFSAIPEAGFITIARGFLPTGRVSFRLRPNSIRRLRSTPIRTGRT